MQTLEEAKAIDVAIYSLLNENNIPYEIDDIILSEYGTTVVGLEMMRSVNEENAEEIRKVQVVKSAFSTLSSTGQEIVKENIDIDLLLEIMKNSQKITGPKEELWQKTNNKKAVLHCRTAFLLFFHKILANVK